MTSYLRNSRRKPKWWGWNWSRSVVFLQHARWARIINRHRRNRVRTSDNTLFLCVTKGNNRLCCRFAILSQYSRQIIWKVPRLLFRILDEISSVKYQGEYISHPSFVFIFGCTSIQLILIFCNEWLVQHYVYCQLKLASLFKSFLPWILKKC